MGQHTWLSQQLVLPLLLLLLPPLLLLLRGFWSACAVGGCC